MLAQLADQLETAAGRTRTADEDAEWRRCADDLVYFVETYVYIYNATERRWLRFVLWLAQAEVLRLLPEHRRIVMLKARQLGMTWLVLAYVLHQMIFRPVATALLWSKRDDEAMELIKRLKGMHARLPTWMQEPAAVSNDHTWRLATGSEARAFPTTGGDSYTASIAVVDEADLIGALDRLLQSAEPTIDAGGQLILLSRVNKATPGSRFQRIYQAAVKGLNAWKGIFLSWRARPDRTDAWYQERVRDALANEGSLDPVYESYPATEAEALAPRSKDKRIAGVFLQACYAPLDADMDAGAMALGLADLRVYAKPQPGRAYVIGADPAEGNPTSDPSALKVLDVRSGEEAASLSGRYEPAVFAAWVAAISRWYGGAPALIERNNHGHTVLLWLRDHAPEVRLLRGLDGKAGWLSNSVGKVQLYNELAEACAQAAVTIHDLTTYLQVASIDGGTLRAPTGDHDDDADAFALAHAGRGRSLHETEGRPAGGSTNHSAALRQKLGGQG